MEKKTSKSSKRFLVWILFLISITCIAASIYFIFRVFDAHHMRPMPRQTNVDTIQGWMTLPYISKVYGVPIKELEEGLKINTPNKHTNIDQLARETNKSSAQMIEEVKSVVAAFQVLHPTPPPLPLKP